MWYRMSRLSIRHSQAHFKLSTPPSPRSRPPSLLWRKLLSAERLHYSLLIFCPFDSFSIVFPLFLVPASIIGLAYRQFAIGYLNTGRDLRRMESNTRSPIFSGFGELLEGIVTVRAFSAEQKFLDGLHQKIDQTTKVHLSRSSTPSSSNRMMVG